MPHSATFGKSSWLHSCSPTRATRSGLTGRGQQVQDVPVPVAGQRGNGHGVESGVLAGRGADVGVGVDPQDRQVVAVAVREGGERGDADGALTAEGDDPGRAMLLDHPQGAGELLEEDPFGLDTVDPC